MAKQIRENILRLKNLLKQTKLIAVSKGHGVDAIREAIGAGQRDFGENRVEEFSFKYQQLIYENCHWHFIGHLQRNKAKDVVGKSILIHSLDSEKLAATINRLAREKTLIQNCLIEVNLTHEPQKNGCLPEDVFDLVENMNDFASIDILGLMMMGTETTDSARQRQEFAELKKLLQDINAKKLYKQALTELSMGMSASYRAAIEEGSTMVRVGTEIFGRREG